MTDSAPPTSGKPPCQRDDALVVLKRLREAGHIAYFAGGCVRDELMGLVPKDYDVATDASPQRVRELFSSTQAVGAAFGVILVRHRKSIIEVATFRTDVSYEDGRRPTAVRFTTAEEDAKRRDFTINGLFLDPIENKVIDYVGGQEDIKRRVLRAIKDPDERFEEDHLRLLRAVRFAARFDLQIEPATAQAIARHAPRLARISPERIAEELRLILVPASRCTAWQMLWHFGLLNVIFRELPEQEPISFDPAWSLVCALPASKDVKFGLALCAAVLCYRWRSRGAGMLNTLLAPDEVRKCLRMLRKLLRISNDEQRDVEESLLGLLPLLDTEPTIARLKRFFQRDTHDLSIELLKAMMAVGENRQRGEWLLSRFASLTDVSPPPLLTGDDLIARGLQPGPAFKAAMEFAYDQQLEGRVTTHEDALRVAEQKVREIEQARKPAADL